METWLLQRRRVILGVCFGNAGDGLGRNRGNAELAGNWQVSRIAGMCSYLNSCPHVKFSVEQRERDLPAMTPEDQPVLPNEKPPRTRDS